MDAGTFSLTCLDRDATDALIRWVVAPTGILLLGQRAQPELVDFWEDFELNTEASALELVHDEQRAQCRAAFFAMPLVSKGMREWWVSARVWRELRVQWISRNRAVELMALQPDKVAFLQQISRAFMDQTSAEQSIAGDDEQENLKPDRLFVGLEFGGTAPRVDATAPEPSLESAQGCASNLALCNQLSLFGSPTGIVLAAELDTTAHLSLTRGRHGLTRTRTGCWYSPPPFVEDRDRWIALASSLVFCWVLSWR
jgi:hypothetical protein